MERHLNASSYGLDWALERVAAFHNRAGHPAPKLPSPLAPERAAARARWMQEEISEFLGATGVVDQADAMIDLIYFALGTLVELGVPAESLFDVVHRANMRKLQGGMAAPERSDGKIMKISGWVGPESEMASVLTSAFSGYKLVCSNELSVLNALCMVAERLAIAGGPELEQSEADLQHCSWVGKGLADLLQLRQSGFTDDFSPIEFVHESVFDRVLSDALAEYPAVGVGVDRAYLSGQGDPSCDFLLVAKVQGSQVLVVDPNRDSPGPLVVNMDRLHGSVRAASDGVHRFRAGEE